VRIVLAIDDSVYSKMAIKMLKALQLSANTTITVMTVVPEHTFLGGITIDKLFSKALDKEETHKAQQNRAASLLQESVDVLKTTDANLESVVYRGKPAEKIIEKAHDMGADLIVLGAKGTSNSSWFPMGSVGQKVMKYAGCSVLLIREGPKAIRRVFLATDGSDHSDQVARLLFDLPLPKQSQVTLLTALQSHTDAMTKTITFERETDRRILGELKTAEEKIARNLMNNIKKQFEEQGYKTSLWLLRGEPAEEILEAANELNPELIALGAKGLTNAKSVLLGSVAERVARFSKYSVLIVRTHQELE